MKHLLLSPLQQFLFDKLPKPQIPVPLLSKIGKKTLVEAVKEEEFFAKGKKEMLEEMRNMSQPEELYYLYKKC